MITTADKGKTLTNIPKQAYDQKIINFINDNSFVNMTHNPTEQYQEVIRSKLNNIIIIQRNQKWRLINLNHPLYEH
jgi:hypothetical protein